MLSMTVWYNEPDFARMQRGGLPRGPAEGGQYGFHDPDSIRSGSAGFLPVKMLLFLKLRDGS